MMDDVCTCAAVLYGCVYEMNLGTVDEIHVQFLRMLEISCEVNRKKRETERTNRSGFDNHA